MRSSFSPSQTTLGILMEVITKKDVVSTLKKLLIGILVYEPLINSVFFFFNAGLQGTI